MKHSLRLLTLGPSDEPLLVRLYIQPVGDQWVAMLVMEKCQHIGDEVQRQAAVRVVVGPLRAKVLPVRCEKQCW